MKVLLDTCIVADVLQHREPFWKDSYQVMLTIANRHAEGFLAARSFGDIYHMTRQATQSDQETRKILSTLLIPFGLLDTAGADCRRALSAEAGDYEDAMMVEAARREGMDCIVTRDRRGYGKSTITVYDPAEFLCLFSPEEEKL